MMFTVHCPLHEATVLLTRRNVVGMFDGPLGPVLRWRCNCGAEGFLDRRGSVADQDVAALPITRQSGSAAA